MVEQSLKYFLSGLDTTKIILISIIIICVSCLYILDKKNYDIYVLVLK